MLTQEHADQNFLKFAQALATHGEEYTTSDLFRMVSEAMTEHATNGTAYLLASTLADVLGEFEQTTPLLGFRDNTGKPKAQIVFKNRNTAALARAYRRMFFTVGLLEQHGYEGMLSPATHDSMTEYLIASLSGENCKSFIDPLSLN